MMVITNTQDRRRTMDGLTYLANGVYVDGHGCAWIINPQQGLMRASARHEQHARLCRLARRYKRKSYSVRGANYSTAGL